VYFTGYILFPNPPYSSYATQFAHRVRVDGSELEAIGPEQTHEPSASSSGERVVWRDDARGLVVKNMRTGEEWVSGLRGYTPEWSHGDSIAYLPLFHRSIRLMASDGAGDRPVSDGLFSGDMAWSADDQWLAVHEASENRLELIHAATGLRIALPFTRGMHSPIWPSERQVAM
jgi:hypothetical protein